MSILDLRPGRHDFAYRVGNTFSTEVDWSINLTGYTVTTEIVSLVTGTKVVDVATTLTDAALGKVGLSFPALSVCGTYGWRQTWVSPSGETRTGLAGYVEVTR